jgi:hypothetical protein
MRVVGGRIVEHWGLPDHWALLRQIGAIERETSGESIRRDS